MNTLMTLTRPWRTPLIATLLALLAACGGGGGDDGGGVPVPTGYTIAGTVSGLAAGGGLVLRNNATDSLSVPAAGGFSFATRVAAGGAYAVTVASQPTGQNCTVGNGSGTATANVSNVLVECVNVQPPPPPPANTFAIGGTVSGLTGSGMVLQNNDGNDLPVLANGAFAFTTRLATGASYAVRVATQPGGQSCAVTAGSGAVASANVTSVAVACTNTPPPPPPPDLFAIGGTVSGLTSNGLVLQNNGADGLSVVAGATGFGFPVRVASGSPYAVTVAQQPSGVTCTLANASGTATANVSNVAVRCAPASTVLALQSIDPADGATEVSRAVSPQLVFSASLDPATVRNGIRLATPVPLGNESFIADTSNGQLNLQLIRKLLPAADYQIDVNAQVVRGANGEQLDASLTRRFTTRDAQWAGAATITSFGGIDPGAPQVALTGSGNAFAVWAGTVRPGRAVMWSRFNGAWSAPLPIAAVDSDEASTPRIGVDRLGQAVAVWAQIQPSGASQVRASRFTGAANGLWGSPVDITAPSLTASIFDPQLAVQEADGTAIALWSEVEGAISTLHASRLTPGVGWSAPAPVSSSAVTTSNARVAIDPSSGNAIAIWNQFDGTRKEVVASRFKLVNGVGTWHTPVSLRGGPTTDVGAPEIAMHRDGSATAVWYAAIKVTTPPGPDQVQVWSSSFRDDGGSGQWSAVQRANSMNSTGNPTGDRSVINPHITEIAGTGESVATWVQVIDTGTAVRPMKLWISRRAADDTALWSEPELVARRDAGSDTDTLASPRVTADRIGNLVVTWRQNSAPAFTVWSRRWQQRSASWDTAQPVADLLNGPAQPVLNGNASGDAALIWPERLISSGGQTQIGIRARFFQ